MTRKPAKKSLVARLQRWLRWDCRFVVAILSLFVSLAELAVAILV